MESGSIRLLDDNGGSMELSKMDSISINEAGISLASVSYTHLVHISEMSERYIKHPLEAVSVGDVVDVRVLGVDMKKKRISLSMKGIK